MRAIQECGFRMMKSSYHIVFQGGPRESITVELHWNLIGSSKRQTEDYLERVWERALPLNAGDQIVCRMYPLDCLLYLCAHLVWQHPREQARLLWYYDLYLLIQRYGGELDWAELMNEALQAGWAEPLHQALAGVEQRFGAQPPQGFLDVLAGKASKVIQMPDGERAHELRMRRWLWTATGKLPWSLRLRMWLGLLLPDPAYMRWRYQPRAEWLLPVYYPLRWWLMLRDGLASWMK